MIKVRVINNFHNTTCIAHMQLLEGHKHTYRISRKASSALCGLKGCKCSYRIKTIEGLQVPILYEDKTSIYCGEPLPEGW